MDRKFSDAALFTTWVLWWYHCHIGNLNLGFIYLNQEQKIQVLEVSISFSSVYYLFLIWKLVVPEIGFNKNSHYSYLEMKISGSSTEQN